MTCSWDVWATTPDGDPSKVHTVLAVSALDAIADWVEQADPAEAARIRQFDAGTETIQSEAGVSVFALVSLDQPLTIPDDRTPR